MTSELIDLQQAIQVGSAPTAVELTQKAIGEGLAPNVILDAMTVAMRDVGDRFQRNEIYVPEMLIAARAMMQATAVSSGAGWLPDTRGDHGGDRHHRG